MTKIQCCHITQDPFQHKNSKGFKFCNSNDVQYLVCGTHLSIKKRERGIT